MQVRNDLLLGVRALCRRSLLDFTKFLFAVIHKREFIESNHHKMISDALMKVLRGNCRKLIINMPPRYGKTELAVKNFIAYGLALNPASRFIHLSYSDDLAHDNSEEVRDIVQSEEYSILFPDVRISQSSHGKKKWLTTEGGGVYATSTGGQVTGFGAGMVDELSKEVDGICDGGFGGAIIIDDPIKPEDALSDTKREAVNQRFETTIRNRVNSRNTPIIIIMQRLHQNDLCGYLLSREPTEWEVLSLPAIIDGKPLWEFKHTLAELERLREINRYVFETQYLQNPTPMSGLLYNPEGWKTYTEIPYTARRIRKNYTDTADTGADNHCSIDYIETEIGNYILSIVYTDEPMETTEPMCARQMTLDRIEVANIESNNGGRGYARNVEAQMRMAGNTSTRVQWFHQSGNKEARIFTRAAEVQNLTYFPNDWRSRYPRFASELDGMMKSGHNAHDDGSDALTGTIEKRGSAEYMTYDGDVHGRSLLVYVPDVDLQGGAWCRSVTNDDGIYITDAGLERPTEDIIKSVDVVLMECSEAAMTELAKVRKLHDVKARKARSKRSIMEMWQSAVKGFLFARQEDMRPFMDNLTDSDITTSYRALYVLCSTAEWQKK